MKKSRKGYFIKFTDGGLKNVRSLKKGEKNALKKKLRDKLTSDPTAHSGLLRGPLEGFRSFHFRDLRVVFKVFESFATVAVFGVGKHSPDIRWDIYRRLEAFVGAARHVEKALASIRGFTKPPGSD